MSEEITIPREEYESLIKDQLMLRALEAAGVDNWSGFDYALESLEEDV